MNKAYPTEILGQGRFLRLVRRSDWEFVQRTNAARAVFIGAITADGCILITEEYRVPVEKAVIGCPAGLVGDIEGQEAESLETAVKRELVEETGYEAQRVALLTEGPTSPGQSDESIAIVLAEGLRKMAAGGGVDGEHILVHKVPLSEVHAWLHDRAQEGRPIDPKVYTVLYFMQNQRKPER